MIDEYEAAELFKMRDSLRKAEHDFEAKDKTAKAAKKRMEAEQKEFNKYVDDLANPTPRLPFKADPETADSPPVPDPDAEDYRVVEDDERWRLTVIEDLAEYGATKADIRKLFEATPSITTLGELADYTSGGKRRLVDIPGIGEKTADRITDAYICWYEAHPKKIVQEKPPGNADETSPQDASGHEDDESIDQPSTGALESKLGASGEAIDDLGNDYLDAEDLDDLDESMDDELGFEINKG